MCALVGSGSHQLLLAPLRVRGEAVVIARGDLAAQNVLHECVLTATVTVAWSIRGAPLGANL